MKKITDYGNVFNVLVEETAKYVQNNNLKAMILGISGGIDSTVCAAICHEVSLKTGIPLIGRSLPTTFNKKEEITSADLVGKAFCSNYKAVSINLAYRSLLSFIGTMEDSMLDLSGNTLYDIQGEFPKQQTDLANGNIQARLRMIYLYNLASIHKGLVIDTDNLTEHNLGYWTIHGDVGDFNPTGSLWKTEIFELAEWLAEFYDFRSGLHSNPDLIALEKSKAYAIKESLKLKPTAGLGITNSDLEEIGAESYDQVDQVLKDIIHWKKIKLLEGYDSYKTISYKTYMESTTIDTIPFEIIEAIAKRHFNSEFKRKNLPIVITRNGFFV